MQANKLNWLEAKDLILINRIHVEAIGGNFGIPNRSKLEAAVVRPQLSHYEEGENDLLALTAQFIIGICEQRPFTIANKATAFSAGRTLLVANGYDFNPRIDQVRNADGKLTIIDYMEKAPNDPKLINEFANWLHPFVQESMERSMPKTKFKAELIFPENTPKVSTKEVLANI